MWLECDQLSAIEAIEALLAEEIEPRRVCRRLHSLRRWSHDEEDIKSIFA
jgi:hypothetical protein